MTLVLSSDRERIMARMSRKSSHPDDADLDFALVEGLADHAIVSSGDIGWTDFPNAPPPRAEQARSVSAAEEPTREEYPEATPLSGLSDAPAFFSRAPDTADHESQSSSLDPADVTDAEPEQDFGTDFETALPHGLLTGPATAPATLDDPHWPLNFGQSALAPERSAAAVAPTVPVEIGQPEVDPPETKQVPARDPTEPADLIDDDLKSALLAELADASATAPQDPNNPDVSAGSHSGEVPPDADDETPEADSDSIFDFEQTLLESLPDGVIASFDEQELPALPEASAAMSEGSPAATDADDLPATDDFASELLEGLSDSPGVSSGDPEPPDLPAARESVDASFDSYSVEHSQFPDDRADSVLDTVSNSGLHGDADHGPAAALAFATDPETERALREGLLGYEGTLTDLDEPQVWLGGIKAAISALAAGYTSGLVIVDLDGIPFPVGAIHEFAEVCEPGTAVIALGSEDTARVNREMLLAGVSDYLVKPVTAETVRHAALRATGAEEASAVRGCVAGFSGTGGSGATTLAAATALHAAGQGRYVSVLDLSRTVSAMGLLLDVEPAPGLDQLFDIADRSPPDPKLLDGVRTERSERISVYAYRLGSSLPPVPSMRALVWLLDQLRRRSQLVLVDGLDDPETGFDLSGEMNLRILVVEPTPVGCVRAARTIGLLGGSAPILLVQNHTRKFDPKAGTSLLMKAGVGSSPDIAVPFDASLPELASRGWPGERLPRAFRKPVAALAEGIFAQAFDVMPAEQAAGA